MKRLFRWISVAAGLLIFALFLAYFVPDPFAKPFLWLYGYSRAGEMKREETSAPATGADADPAPAAADALPLLADTADVSHYLLIGLDTRTVDSVTGNPETDRVSDARSDAMILVSVNRKTKKITLTSLLRDTLVEIPGVGRQKLCHAFAYGQVPLLLQTLKENFNIDVRSWAYLDFSIFIDAVDALGGLDLQLSAAEAATVNRMYLAELNKIYSRPDGTDYLPEKDGLYHLNGYQALGYVRDRSDKSANGDLFDWSRLYRQKTVLQQMKEKVRGMNFVQIDRLAKSSLSRITTNLDRKAIAALVMNSVDYLDYEVQSVNLPALSAADGTENVYDPSGAYLGITFDAPSALSRLYQTIYD